MARKKNGYILLATYRKLWPKREGHNSRANLQGTCTTQEYQILLCWSLKNWSLLSPTWAFGKFYSCQWHQMWRCFKPSLGFRLRELWENCTFPSYLQRLHCLKKKEKEKAFLTSVIYCLKKVKICFVSDQSFSNGFHFGIFKICQFSNRRAMWAVWVSH